MLFFILTGFGHAASQTALVPLPEKEVRAAVETFLESRSGGEGMADNNPAVERT